MQSDKKIRVRGARQHNLKGISLDIPRDALTVITGLSGSGKSSLAFDTLYAEGRRRYVESLSSYARQFLEQMQKPDVDHIEGLPPTVAIGQHGGSSNPRSTVATTTELYDYLRTLFAQLGTPHCWKCAEPIRSQPVSTIVDAVLERHRGNSVMILAPVEGRPTEILDRLRKEGLVRIRLNGEVLRLDDDPALPKGTRRIDAVVDRLKIKADSRSRLADSLEFALRLGEGIALTSGQEGQRWVDDFFSSRMTCPSHWNVTIPEMSPRLFSFNSPFGACPKCDGLGTILEFDAELLVPDPNLSLAQGAIDIWRREGRKNNDAYHKKIKSFCERFGASADAPFRNLPEEIRRILLFGTTRSLQEKYGAPFEGVVPTLNRRWQKTESDAVKQKLHNYLSEAPCRRCNGSRLNAAARTVTIDGLSIADIVHRDIDSALTWADELSFTGEHKTIADPLIRALHTRLDFLQRVGVGYLNLDRSSATLSGGEAQRIRLATQLGSGLVGVCYILDEPTIGLHSRDSARLVQTLQHLRSIGNTVIVVEHDERTISAAEHVVDIGPGAGEHGGEIIAEGSYEQILKDNRSITGQYLSGKKTIALPQQRRTVDLKQSFEIRGARENNLKNIDVQIPLGRFVCITGVSGSGKSTLINDILLRALRRRIYGAGARPGDFDRLTGGQQIDKVIEIDQSPIGRTPRSNPATYVGVFDLIRRLYAKTREAKIRGYSASRFSFNVKGGRCEACQGQGTRRIEMHFLPDVYVTCDSCKGTRYNRETLEIRYRGQDIADVLNMRVGAAKQFFDSFAKIKQLLAALGKVGLGYMTLGQSSTTLSGGEAQRIRLAAELGKTPSTHTLYILDEPTTGLHFADVQNLLNVLNRLADQGNTVLVIEHNLHVIKNADWIIDLGPEGGQEGGKVVATGTPEEVAGASESYTGGFLAEILGINKKQCASAKADRPSRRPANAR